MATTTQPVSVTGVGNIGGTGISRWLLPSFFDLVFLSIPLFLFGIGDGGFALLLGDGDTGWHIRTGEWILDNQRIPATDIFSFTKYGQPWFAWEWGSDVIYGFLMRLAGLKGILILSALLFALFGAISFRHLLWRRVSLFIALPLTMLAVGSAMVHVLARPHLWTMMLVALASWMIAADMRRPGWLGWALIPLAMIWVNLHGGWLALIAILGLVSIGTALEAWRGEPEKWILARRYAMLTGLCLLASLVNPYGWQLHAHTFQYLRADFIKDMVSEFKSPSFRSEHMLQFEVLLLGGVAAAGLMAWRGQFVGALLILFWAHASLVSARHLPLYCAIALPWIADEADRLWRGWTANARKSSLAGILNGLAEESRPAAQRTTLWAVIPIVLVAIGVIRMPWPSNPPAILFPEKMVNKHQVLLASSRVFTSDQWGDYLIFRSFPQQRVFFDGRSDFYGEKHVKEYLAVMNGRWDWQQVLDRHRVDVVLAASGWGVVSAMKLSPQWRVIDDDGKAILFTRVSESKSRGAP